MDSDQPRPLLTATFQPHTHTFHTHPLPSPVGPGQQPATCPTSSTHHPQQQPQQHGPLLRRPSTFKDYLARALSVAATTGPNAILATSTSMSYTLKRVNYFISCLLCLNVFMSIANTLLLSFVVKSIQVSEQNLLFRDKRLSWDFDDANTKTNTNYNNNHLNRASGMILDLNGRLSPGKVLSVATIESGHQDKPLIIEPSGYGADNLNQLELGTSHANPTAMDHRHRHHHQQPGHRFKGQIMISSSFIQQAGNYIRVPSSASDAARRHLTKPNSKHLAQSPVEISTSSLVINQITGGADQTRRPYVKSTTGGQGKSDNEAAAAAAAAAAGKRHTNHSKQLRYQTSRLLELDSQRQSIVLPLLNKVDLHPAHSAAGTLVVRDEFGCGAEGLSGTLDNNLDIQTRSGNLSCASRRTLRLVSRSGRLNVAPARLLLLDAPRLQLGGAPQMVTPTSGHNNNNNKLFIPNGIEYINVEQAYSQRASSMDESQSGPAIHPHLERRPLRAYNLVLIDDILMASPD